MSCFFVSIENPAAADVAFLAFYAVFFFTEFSHAVLRIQYSHYLIYFHYFFYHFVQTATTYKEVTLSVEKMQNRLK